MTVTVNINGLESITEAVNNLARALGAHGVPTSFRDGMTAAAPETPGQPSSGLSHSMPMAPGALQGQAGPAMAPPASSQPGWTGQQPAAGPAMGPVPTTAVPLTYTQDQIAVAMTGLVDQGKQPQVMQVLAQFGAGSLMQVPKEQYQALAVQLRALGAAL